MKVSPVHIGLTGGIGSGKSAVASVFQELGAVVVDADAISRAAAASNGAAIPEIATEFGPEFIGQDGALNRQKMREVAFKDFAAKKKLEGILHPLVRREMLTQAKLAASRGALCVVFDIPLLVESGTWRNALNSVLVVDCTVETQILRVKARSGLAHETIQSIISAQASRSERLHAADMVLFNDGCSLEQLAILVQAFASEIGLSFSDWKLPRDPLRIPL